MKENCSSSVQQTALSILNNDCRACPNRLCAAAVILLEKVVKWYEVCQEPICCLKTERMTSFFLCLRQVALSDCREVTECQPIFLGVLGEVAQIGQAAFPEEMVEERFVITSDVGKPNIIKTNEPKPKVHSTSARLPVWKEQARYWAEKMVKALKPPRTNGEDEVDFPKAPFSQPRHCSLNSLAAFLAARAFYFF